MRKSTEGGEFVDIAWIPEKFAQINKLVNIKRDTGELDGPWKIVVIHSKLEADKVEISERDFLKQRRVSDI